MIVQMDDIDFIIYELPIEMQSKQKKIVNIRLCT